MGLKDKIVERLKEVIDPETNEDVVSMGLIKDLEVSGNSVSLKFKPSVPICPLGFKLAFDIQNAIKELDGVKKVDLEVIDFIHADKVNRMLKEGVT